MKTNNKTLSWAIYILLAIGILGAGSLVITEINTGQGCPKFGVIPACFIILVCFIIPLITHALKRWNFIYFLFTGVAGIIALVASIMQFKENAECPKTNTGIPMCYLSLLLFSTLIILKIKQLYYNNNN